MSPDLPDLGSLESLNLPARGPETSPLAGAVQIRTSPFWLPQENKTQDLPLEELEWAPRPFSDEQYIENSAIVRIRDFKVEVIRRPLEALEPILIAVYLDLNRIVYRGSDLKPGPYMARHMHMASTLLIARQGSKIGGFSLATYQVVDGKVVLFHNATMIDPAARGHDLTFLLNAIHYKDAWKMAGFRPYYTAARTQNPLVYGAMLSTGPYYPRPGAAPPADIQKVGSRIAEMLNPDAEFSPNFMVQRGAWNKAGVSVPPRHWRSDVNDYCDTHLDYRTCDSLIVVGRFGLREMAWVYWRAFIKQVSSPKSRSG